MTRILTTILVLALAVTGLFANECDAPTGLQAQHTNDGVLLSWNTANNALSYWLKVENANNNPQLFEIEIPVNATSHLVTGLNANASYKFKVRTVCSGDKSDWTAYVPFQTAIAGGGGGTGGGGNTGGGGTGVCAIPEGLVVSNITGTEATLTWNAVAGAQQYEVEVEDNENTPLFAFNTLTSETTVTVTGLSPNGQYQFKVKSKCGGGLSSDYSAWVFFNTGTGTGGNTGGNTGGGNTGGGTGGACGIPAGLSVSDLTGTSAVLSWSPVAGALKYEVEVEDDENTPLFAFNAITSDTTIAVIGLAPGGSYQFKVKSKCDGGLSSDYSGWVFFGAGATGGGNTGGGGTGGACEKPANLQALQITTTSAMLTWSPVAGALKYEIEVEDDENTIAFSFNALTADTAVLIIGLTPGGNYQFKVKSKCGGGMSSDYSDWNFFSTATQLVAPATGSAGLPSNGAVHAMSAFRVFPNPATSEVAVQLDEPATAPLSVTVMNAQGRQMMRYNGLDGTGGRIDLSVSNLDSGLYVVVISDGQSMKSQQVLIAR
ncbi:MAG: fibronectin type III domain-containing protein [Saprospiraceae bacterium]|nr:fibronectin type III domain-containing protein [Saprospiraceae bacterium]